MTSPDPFQPTASVPTPPTFWGRPLVRWLYSQNPFYIISALLLLFAVQSAYGELEIGAINAWLMMGVFAGYTSILAFIGVAIIRWGKVWQDARSVLLLVLLMCLALSICADDLFARIESSTSTWLMFSGYLFSAFLSELVLRGARIRFPPLYRWPFHGLIALFFLAPWWCSPAIHPRSPESLEWTIFAFPLIASGLLLTLLPAVKRGSAYIQNNGTPWPWPLYPWSIFFIFFVAIGFRTFALAMTFGPAGPMWISLGSGMRAISFDTLWGPYFLIPPIFAILVLLVEGSVVTRNMFLAQRVLRSAPLLLVLAVPMSRGPVFLGFLRKVTDTTGSPLWLVILMLIGLYCWSAFRRIRGAIWGTWAMVFLLTFVGPDSTGFRTLHSPESWPLAVVALGLLTQSVLCSSSKTATLAAIAGTGAVFLAIPEPPWKGFSATLSAHLLWGALTAVGLLARDPFARKLRMLSALFMPFATLLLVLHPQAEIVPIIWKAVYIASMAGLSLILALSFRIKWYLYTFISLLSVMAYGIMTLGFRQAVQQVGMRAMTAFLWSSAALILAVLISAHKANWLPKRLLPRWPNGHSPVSGQATVPSQK
ncbi:MAG: hypothetical protein KDA80_18975 [Planctomycetaceae bacterium]|nr:hypothetical protein [Planctomycetaceae bacterium]